MSTNKIILDDGKFYIDLNVNYESSTAPGFLSHRCALGPATPGGFECVGGFQKSTDGTWCANINAHYDSETDGDSEVVTQGVTRMDAIAALWSARNQAPLSHQ